MCEKDCENCACKKPAELKSAEDFLDQPCTD